MPPPPPPPLSGLIPRPWSADAITRGWRKLATWCQTEPYKRAHERALVRCHENRDQTATSRPTTDSGWDTAGDLQRRPEEGIRAQLGLDRWRVGRHTTRPICRLHCSSQRPEIYIDLAPTQRSHLFSSCSSITRNSAVNSWVQPFSQLSISVWSRSLTRPLSCVAALSLGIKPTISTSQIKGSTSGRTQQPWAAILDPSHEAGPIDAHIPALHFPLSPMGMEA